MAVLLTEFLILFSYPARTAGASADSPSGLIEKVKLLTKLITYRDSEGTSLNDYDNSIIRIRNG
jgi:hypothetical protein